MSDRNAALDMLSRSKTAEASSLPLAYQLLASSVVTDSTFADGWFRLGEANWSMKLAKSAIQCYRRALLCEMTEELRPRVLNSLAHVLHHTGKNEEAWEYANLCGVKYPDFALAYFNLSMINSVQGHLRSALALAEKACSMSPGHPPLELNRAFQLMFNGRWMEGLKAFEARFPYRLSHFASYPYPKWENPSDKDVVFCVSEQGIGDTLAYARFVERAAKRCSFMHLGVQPELARLFRASFQNLKNINILPQPCPFPPATHWTTFMCLPVALGLTDEEFLGTKNITIPKFTLGGTSFKDKHAKLHVGVSWAGSKANDIDHWRSIPLDYFLDLAAIPGVQLYSLQMDDRSQDIHNMGSVTLIRDLKPMVRDVADTVAILNELDLVICCEGVLAHIAGCMGFPCIVAYSYQGRTIHFGHHPIEVPFYPNHVVVKQNSDHKWEPVFNQIKGILEEELSNASDDERRVLRRSPASGL